MSIKCYHKGDMPRVSAAFTNSAGAAVDPQTVALKYTKPSGDTFTIEYEGSPGGVERAAAGSYYADLSADEAGEWRYMWVTTGTFHGAEPGQFKVLPSQY